MPSEAQYHQLFLGMAKNASKLSKDPRTKVGAVIVTPDKRKVSYGYNGFGMGMDDNPELWADRPEKHVRVIHAEENAIYNAPFDTHGCTLYCTYQPCHKCMPRLLNAGIKIIVYDKPYPSMERKDLWEEAKVLFDQVLQIRLDSKNSK